MKTHYISLVVGVMCLTVSMGQAQNLISDGDFSETTEIIPFDTPTPPLNTWAYWVNYYGNGAEAYPTVVDGSCKFEIINPGDESWNVQLGQWGFPLIQGHTYQLLFDVRADSDRNFGVFLGEDGSSYTNLIGYDKYLYDATTEWQTIIIEFTATAVFDLHKLSFELGGDMTTTYFDNVILEDLGPASPKVVIAGNFQATLGCASDWDPGCEITELTFNEVTGLYTGSFQIPGGNYQYKVTLDGSWNINYGENGIFHGPNIFLCLASGSEEITFTYDPATNLVTTSPVTSGFSPDCLPQVVLAGSFQEELGCNGEFLPDCLQTALIYNSESGLFEGDFAIPSGCYQYKVVLENSWFINYGQEGIFNGPDYTIAVPENPEIIHFTYDPFSHIVTSTPYSGVYDEVTKVSLLGSLQTVTGCPNEYDHECDEPALVFNPDSGKWEANIVLPAGCYSYLIKETFGCNTTLYGENGMEWGGEIKLYVPVEGEIIFTYDADNHLISSSPFSGVPQEVTEVSLVGSLQDELGCASDDDFYCEKPALYYNSTSGFWEGSFTLPAGCYAYRVKETFGCDTEIMFGENGQQNGLVIQLYVPLDGEVTFRYDPQTHIITSTPYGDVSPEMTKVYLIGTLQDELGCANPWEEDCENSALEFNSASGLWEASFVLPAGCYFYWVKESTECGTEYYGENGQIQLYVPEEAEITFSYDPQTHKVNSTPYIGVPQEITSVSLTGTFQEEFGCDSFNNPECDSPALVYDPDSATWKGSFILSAGCHAYWVKETFGCDWTLYGENGATGGDQIQLYIPEEGEVSFSYDPETRIITSTPYTGIPQEVTAVSLTGFPEEVVCASAGENCTEPALQFNPGTGAWEGSFTLPAGCYDYWVREESICNVFYYGENGSTWSDLGLYVPEDAVITFSYNSETHILTSSPYSGVPQEVTRVALRGTLQGELGCNEDWEDRCEYSALALNPASGLWEGSFFLPEGCYTYQVQERFGCEISYYGENGEPWGEIKIYIPVDGLVTFQYDPVSHIVSSTPYSGIPQEVTEVSLVGSMQDELGCTSDWQEECGYSALLFNQDSGMWEGSFTLPAGCYTYQVKETTLCKSAFYGENGTEWAGIELYVPVEGEISFRYNPEMNTIVSTPYTGVPQEVTNVNLVGSLDGQYGSIPLTKNQNTGNWEGAFMAPAGCYIYMIEEVFGCTYVVYYGENGMEWGNELQLFVPSETEISFSYDPQTHIISSTPDFDFSTVNQCPDDIHISNTQGACGAIVNYPQFVPTEYCGGDISSVTQIAGLPGGSLFPIGTTTNTFELVRTTGEVITCSFDVVVTDTESPVIADLQENYEPLWPPNHKMVPVYLQYVTWDNCNIAHTEITITSNEPESTGKGDEAPDWEVVDDHQVLLRAERSAKGDGREYSITIKVTDDSGNSTERTVTVAVAKDQRKITENPVDAVDSNFEYILYPVAASDIVNIKGPKSTSHQPYVIYDISGIMRKQGIINNDRVEISSLSNGTYILKFGSDDGFIFKRFIKN